MSNLPVTSLPRHTVLSDRSLRWMFLVMGMGTLFAYNAFISCTDYFNAINPTEENVSGQMVAYQLTSMTIVTILLLPFSTINNDNESASSFQRFIPMPHFMLKMLHLIDLSSPAKRVLFGFVFTFFFLLAYLLLPQSSITSQTLNIFSTFVGIADATSQSGLYVLAANYDKPILTASATLGGALSGFVVSLLRLLTRGMFETATVRGLKLGADLLMWLSFGFSVILILSVVVVMRDQRVRARMQEGVGQIITMPIEDGRSVDQDENDGAVELEKVNEIRRKPKYDAVSDHNDLGQQQNPPVDVEQPASRLQSLQKVYISAVRLAWKPILSSFLNFFITLALFPGVILDIPSSSNNNSSFLALGDWLPVVLIAVFNGADCFGRYILSFENRAPFMMLMARKEENVSINERMEGQDMLTYFNRLVWLPTFGRILFFPLVVICMVPSIPHPLVNSDVFSCFVVFIFGCSSGFIFCANFTVAPTLVHSKEAKNAISLLLLLAVYFGLMLGAFFGLVVEKAIRNLDN